MCNQISCVVSKSLIASLAERQKYHENLDLRKITDNKKFWKTVKPPLLNKGPNSQKISLKEGDKLVTDDIEIANVLNKHFASV